MRELRFFVVKFDSYKVLFSGKLSKHLQKKNYSARYESKNYQKLMYCHFWKAYRVDHLNLQFIPIILSFIGVYGIRHFGIANFVRIGSVCSILKGLAASEC